MWRTAPSPNTALSPELWAEPKYRRHKVLPVVLLGVPFGAVFGEEQPTQYSQLVGSPSNFGGKCQRMTSSSQPALFQRSLSPPSVPWTAVGKAFSAATML